MLLLQGHLAMSIYALAFSPDGALLASCCHDSTVRLWDCVLGEGKIVAGSPPSHSVAFNVQGTMLAWPSRSNLSCLDLVTQQTHVVKIGYDGFFPKLAFSPDGRTLALVGGSVRLFDLTTWIALPKWKDNGNATDCLAYSPDGSTLATGHYRTRRPASGRIYEHEIKLWSVTEGRPTALLCGHTQFATDLAFAPSGLALAAACGPTLWAWDVPSGRPLLSHRIDARHFKGVAFSPDGRWLATAHNDKPVRFYDTLTWREHTAFDWQIGSVVAIAFAPDGMRAAAASNKGKIVVWDVDL